MRCNARNAFEQGLDIVEGHSRTAAGPAGHHKRHTWITGAFEGSYLPRTKGGKTPRDLGTADIAKATCCSTEGLGRIEICAPFHPDVERH